MLKETRIALTFACVAALCAACDGGGEAPDAPQVDSPPALTNQNPLSLTGSGEAGATIQVRGGSEAVASAQVDGTGRFEVAVPLRADMANVLLVSQSAGGKESEAVVINVTHDGVAPGTPVVEPPTTPTRATLITLRGTAEANGVVVVTGGLEDASGEVGADGSFELSVGIRSEVASLTENVLSVVAMDVAGNTSEPAMVTIIHNPALPLDAPALDELPRFTADAALTVSGSSEAGAMITVSGATEEATGAVGADGRFAIGVTLRANADNHLNVFAVVAATGVGSPPALRTVTHDDVAPDAPELNPTASPTGATTVRISGLSETHAMITITGGAAVASELADEDGRFGVDVMLTADSVNELLVTAADAAGNTSAEVALSVEQDSSLEAPVEVDALPSPTSMNPIMVMGRTEPSSDVRITGGATMAMGTSAPDGSFTISVSLRPNERNELRVSRVGGATATIVVVDHDSVAPAPPSIDAIASPTNRTDLMVSGSTEPLARLSITGGVAAAAGNADGAGRYSVPVTIAEDGESTLSVIATDRAGNSSTAAMIRVTHSTEVPDAPVVDDASPAPTNMPTHVVTGRVTTPRAGVSVRVTGGAASAMAMTDMVTGIFSVEVTLNPNVDNTLSVRSVEGAIESPETFVTITHDDIAPADPDGGRITVGTPGGLGCLVRGGTNVTGAMMAVEALSRVRVENATLGATSVSTTAGADGAFATSINTCSGDMLRITSIDAAGNASGSITATVP